MSRFERPITHDDLLREFQEDEEFRAAWAVQEPRTFLAANVLRLREELGVTQEELARKAGMRQPRIAEIERGDANPTLDTIARVAYALGVSTDALVSDPDGTPADDYHESAPRVVISVELGGKAEPGPWASGFLTRSEDEQSDSAANDNFALSA